VNEAHATAFAWRKTAGIAVGTLLAQGDPMDRLLLPVFLPVLFALAACAREHDDLSVAGNVQTWANTASALGAYMQVYDVLATVDHRPNVFPDATCPHITDDGTTLTLTADCTDAHGDARHGTATVVRGAGGTMSVTLNGWGQGARTTGTATIHDTSPSMRSFDLSLTSAGGASTIYTYSGTVSGSYDGPATFDGTGTIERRGGVLDPIGVVTASTSAQRIDGSVCNGESISGTTTIHGDGRVAVITYDGATACDANHSARWSVDGVEQGLVPGIQCSASPGRGSSTAALAFAAVLAVLTRRSVRRP
jgi:hypothetical protein